MMIDIKQIWIDQESSSGKNVVRKRIESIPGLNCFVGLIGATGARMFQLELYDFAPIHKNYLRKFRGVEIQAIPFNDYLTEYTIILLEKDLTEIFTMFIEDLIEKMGVVSKPHEAITLINQRVNYWKKLFSKATGELLSIEKQRGLFGELYFLRLLLQSSSDFRKSILSWRGAESANQDFTSDKNAVEIKTTKANNPSIHISNEQQLDFTAWDNLFIGLVSVTETSGSTDSLAKLVNDIKKIIDHESELEQEFEAKLERIGMTSDLIEEYNEISYTVNKLRFFHIKDGFPIIVKSNLSSEAIYNVKYQIDISSCHTFSIEEEEVLSAMI